MSKSVVITAGAAYVDIDVFACSLAYQELLKACGVKGESCHTGPFNATVPRELLQENVHLIQRTPPLLTQDTTFVLVDVSDPAHFETFVDEARITHVFDHHFGFDAYWKQRIGAGAVVRPIGACATLIWQEYEKHHVQLSKGCARLLATAILSNTLNLQACVTTDEDRDALAVLEERASLKKDWRKKYYEGTKQCLLKDLKKSISSDTKIIHFEESPLHFCQIEAWSAKEIMDQAPFKALCEELFPQNNWFLSVLDVSSACNWVVSPDGRVLSSLKEILHLEPHGQWFRSQKLWLRKEILKFWQETNRMKRR